MKIMIMRHGKPFLPDLPKIAAGHLGEWIDVYTRSTVQGSVPPEKALQAARECPVIVTSDLVRSTESARALQASSRRVISDKLFREATWPYASVPLLRMRPYRWAALFRILWFMGFGKNCQEPVNELKQRAALAADRLINLSQTHGCVLLVGHGIMNTFIVRELRKKGWTGPKLPGYGYWEVSEYRK